LIAFIANALYVCAVEFFSLGACMRTLIAVLGVPIIYGNLVSVLSKKSIQASMIEIFEDALATMGAGYIIVALLICLFLRFLSAV
jgi:hypothetical protein